MNRYSIRDEYAPEFGRQVLTLWSPPFASTYEGRATELPKGGGYMVTMDYGPKVRVECDSPRTDDNWMAVDETLSAAVAAAVEAHDAERAAERAAAEAAKAAEAPPAPEPTRALGAAILAGDANAYRLRVGVIGAVETAATGNVVLRVGHAEYGIPGWESGAAHVVLTPEEVTRLIDALRGAAAVNDAPCLIVFPAGTPLDQTCPRCHGPAGDHPAPMAGPDDPTPVAERARMRDVGRD